MSKLFLYAWKSAGSVFIRTPIFTQSKLFHSINGSANAVNKCYCHCSFYNSHFINSQKKLLHLSTNLKSNVTIYVIDRHGKRHKAEATVGDSLLDVIIDNDFNFETYGVCEGTISCSTCHIILDPVTYSEMEDPLMDELDMLDLACGLTETSRLGCQVYVTKEMDGITVKLPVEITDARDL